jgi:hypothetical protein
VEPTRTTDPRPRWIAPVLVAVALAVGWPLFLPWTYDTHDGHYAFTNAAQFDRVLRAGEIPVRWLPDLFGGRGLPVFVYFHPLAFYLVSLIHLFGPGFIAASKALELLSLPASGWAMLRWLEAEGIGAGPAAAGAAAYVAAPMHVVELHVKGDPPAALAFVIAPLLLLAIRRAAQGNKHAVPAVAAASATLVLAHSVTALLVAPFAALYALSVLPRPALPPLGRIGSGAALGALVSAFQWLPALVERPFVYIDSVRGILAFDYHEQFVAWWQWFSPLWGYHGSFPGTNDDMSFQIGPVHLAAIGLGAVVLARAPRGARRLPAWGLATAAGALFMTVSPSLPVWEAFDSLKYVQFPWRFLMPLALAGSALLALAADKLPPRAVLLACAAAGPIVTGVFALYDRNLLYGAIALFQAAAGIGAFLGATYRVGDAHRGSLALALLAGALALPWSAVPLHAKLKGEPFVIPVHERDLTPERVRLGIRRTTARDDYLPRTVPESAIPPRDPSQEYLPPSGAGPAPDVLVRSGSVAVSAIDRGPRGLRFAANAPDGGIVALTIHDFPGWRIVLRPSAGGAGFETAHGCDAAGRIVVSLPSGSWIVDARWHEDPLRARSDAASLAGLAVLAALLASSLSSGGSTNRSPRRSASA